MRRPRFVLGWLLVAAVATAGCASSGAPAAPGSRSVTSPPSVSPSAASSSSVSASPTTGGPHSSAAACSAAGLSPSVDPQQGLPQAVARMRDDLAAAAVACDYTLLATTLADRNGPGLSFTFGGSSDAAAFWREQEARGQGTPPMLALRTLLGLPYATLQTQGGELYEWPAAFGSDHPTDPQLAAIAGTGLYPMATLRQWVDTGNGYLGYRVVIGSGGDWKAFVSGD